MPMLMSGDMPIKALESIYCLLAYNSPFNQCINQQYQTTGNAILEIALK
jgi:hypothetical protein